MNAPPVHVIQEAVDAAVCSPCEKSKRGVAICARSSLKVIATGWNHQPQPYACTGSEACRKHCGKLCIHAEVHALHEYIAASVDHDASGADLVHVKVVDGELVPGGGPSCWQCSREILEVGIAGVWLFEWVGDGTEAVEWKFYTAEDFHAETLKNCEIAP